MLDRLDIPAGAESPDPGTGAWFQHEQQILQRLAHVPGVPGPAPASGPDGAPARWATRTFPLADRLLGRPPLSIIEQIDIAQGLAQILAAVHRAGVTHGNLNAANVLLDGESSDPMIIGFGHATTVAEREPAFSHHNSIPGMLATLAPEQTGRTGRPVDQRADLYGLGVVLYQMATGRLPFGQTDPLRLVHDVLARMPVPPADRVPGLPATLSAIVMRLLEKEPDQRYQSAEGLTHDLRRLREDQALGRTDPFSLGEHDFPHRLSAPSRLVGRTTAIAALRTALDDAVRGTCKVALVSGAPGVGKTALINELRPMVTALGGWFVSGKSDQYRRDLATDAVSQTLRALGRLLLTESDADLLRHRHRLIGAVGANAGLIASVQPEIALVLDMAGDSARDSGAHAKDRVIRAALDVMRAIASPERPVVVVLDDLQWASETSTGLIDALFQEDGRPGLLVVGAYRRGEIDATHPLSAMLPRWLRSPVPPVTLRPENLPAAHLSAMIAEMLRLPPQPAIALADIVGARTGGNPFDTVTLLNALRDDGALVRDDDGWRWDDTTIRHHVGEGDVADLLATRIDRLPADTGALLRRMACLGGEADADLLCAASGLAPAVLGEYLTPALEDGLLVMGQSGHAGETMVVRFRHDRVQQAATSRLDAPGRRTLHLGLARLLAARPEFAGIAAEQYLPAVEEVTEADEQQRVIGLFRAAAHTLRLVNPAMTERFLASALALLDRTEGRDGAAADRFRRIAIETNHHAALYHLGRLAEADERYRSIERCRPTALALTEAACVRISSLTFRERPEEAVALGLDMLQRLGVEVPDDEQVGPWTERGLARFRAWAAQEDGILADLALPEASDPRGAAAACLINRMIPPAFFANMPIMPWLVFECQRLWVEHGPCAALVGPLSHAGFATIMLAQDFWSGYAAARRVLAVCEHHRHEPEGSHAGLVLTLSAAQWFEPLEMVVDRAQRALDGLLQGGDQQNAGFAGYVLIPTLLECVPTLEEYLAQVDARLAFAAGSGNGQTHAALLGYRQLARALLGRTEGPGTLTDASFDADKHLATYAENGVASAYARLAYTIASAIAGDEEALAEHSAAAMALLPFYQATLSMSVAHLFRAVALAESLRSPTATMTSEDRAAALRELAQCQDWLASRAADAAGNFEHLLYLVDAERAWTLGAFLDAARAFDAAIRTVRGRQRPWHAALIAERAARFHLAHGLEHVGRGLLAEARDLYQVWGAVAKVRALERANAPLRAGKAGSWATATPETIDLLAVLRACQALSSETSLDRLHVLVREVLSAATGATDVRIVLRRDEPNGWFVPAIDTGGTGGPWTPLDSPAGQRLVPLSAFRYTERTLEPLLVSDVACDGRFTADPYLRERRCRSLLVVPILSHGTPRAMLVLEHRLSGGAFTADRLDAVRLIAGQLAVSVENAIVYEELEERVRQRTRELRAAQSELIATARHIGMAEIASNVLHNVGNVLTSVTVSAGLAVQRIRVSKVDGLAQAVVLLREHEANLSDYLTRDDRGKLLPEYLSKVSEALVAERRDIVSELDRLVRNIDHIIDIVATQQAHASGTSLTEPTDVEVLVEDAIRINAEVLERHQVTIVRRFGKVLPVLLDKVRVLLILVNLISNAKAAMASVTDRPRVITLSTEMTDQGMLRIGVEDSGEGIRSKHLARIFTHGFTTRDDGHGFGLHSCALAASEMGGTLLAVSDGPGCGAAFTLEIPVAAEEAPC
ncbi:MAG: AAA family ATPase [Dactylosporangium sp.]|nr:AAA family ATPase [Dactylosporangium sp.]NNJ59852.1 AAA family ATPase [Dactylosporangium sp.]